MPNLSLSLNTKLPTDILYNYLNNKNKKERSLARKYLLKQDETVFYNLVSSEFKSANELNKLKLLRLMGRYGSKSCHMFLFNFITAKVTNKFSYDLRITAIEALSYNASLISIRFLKRTLKKSYLSAYDEATVYTLVEAISHSEQPEAPTAFESAKYIPKKFKLKKSYKQFAEKLSDKITQTQVKWQNKNTYNLNLSDKKLESTTDITVTTLNLGLLHSPFAKVPHYPERSRLLPTVWQKYLSSKGATDIICLQELWYQKDFDVIKSISESNGYTCAVTDYNQCNGVGLQILIKKSILFKNQTNTQFIAFRNAKGKRIRALFEKAGQIQRGLLSVSLTTLHEKKLFVATTHLTPLPRFFGLRNEQIKCLITEIKNKKRNHHHSILAGDLNVAVDYDGFDNTPEIFWELDRFNYLNFVTKTKAQDSYSINRHLNTGYTINADMAGDKYTNKNVKQRLDYIFVFRNKSRSQIRHLKSWLSFIDPIDDNKLYISDHFAVCAQLQLLRTKNLL